jgi:hypothetical protein
MHKPYLKLAIWAALAIVAVQVSLGIAAYFFLPDWPTRGQFGDSLVQSTPLFWTAAGLICDPSSHEDLELSKELEMTGKELARTASTGQSKSPARGQQQLHSQPVSAANFLLEHYKSKWSMAVACGE